jgi:DNA-binding IclR family transcriptional regulator
MTPIQLLVKAGQMIDVLAQIGPVTPAELAKAMAEPRPSVYRLAGALQQAGFVRPASDGQLELGLGVLDLGDAAAEALVDRVGLREQLRWVRRELGLSVYFCVLREDGALCLDRIDGMDVELLQLAPGRTLPLHAGAASRALLAHTPSAWSAVASRAPFERLTSATTTTAQALVGEWEEVAARGWSLSDGDLAEGIAAIGVPVHEVDGTLLGAVSVAGLRRNVLEQQARAVDTLRAAAEKIAGPSTAAFRRAGPTADASPLRSVDAGRDRAEPPALAVIAKASALLNGLAEQRIASSTRLAELMDEPLSSVYRMVGTLVEMGWVEQIDRRGAYRVGGEFVSLSGAVTGRLDVRRAAVPVLQDIHAATGETAFLCIRRGSRAVCIERIDGVRVNSQVLRLGESLPLHMGAAPRALLAFESRAAWEEYASAAAHDERWRRAPSRSELYADLESIQALGHVRSDGDVTGGIAAIGAPIFDHRGDVVASLSVSGLREGVLDESRHPSVTERVLDGARILSAHLGHRPNEVGAKPAAAG